MRDLVMILSVAWLLPSVAMCAAETTAGADVAGPVLDRVAKMDAAEQQAWLGRLEQRAGRAARLTLGPEEAAKQQARIAGLLHQKLVTWQVLRELIEETDRRERAAIRSAQPERIGAIPEKPSFQNGRPAAEIAGATGEKCEGAKEREAGGRCEAAGDAEGRGKCKSKNG